MAHPTSRCFSMAICCSLVCSIGLLVLEYIFTPQKPVEIIARADVRAAYAALSAVERSVVTGKLRNDLPLEEARQNLALARTYLAQGEFKYAYIDLQAVCQSLGNYAQGGGRHAREARLLRVEIANYSRSIGTNHDDADHKITSWWNQTSEWISPGHHSQPKVTGTSEGSEI